MDLWRGAMIESNSKIFILSNLRDKKLGLEVFLLGRSVGRFFLNRRGDLRLSLVM